MDQKRAVPSGLPLPAGEGRGEGRSDSVGRARRLRKRQSSCEALLWRHLRRRGVGAAKFRRQHPVGGYVVDFFCEDAQLVIEVDGDSHANAAQRSFDDRRTRELGQLGIQVLRFWNSDVRENLEGVLQVIYERVRRPPSP